MDIGEIADRAEITQLIVDYTRALDGRDWDRFDAIFAEGARIDYSAFGGAAGDLAAAKAFLAASMPAFAKTQHLLGLPDIKVDGDTATAVTPCDNPMRIGEGPDAQILWCSLWYHHDLVRTQGGWRISSLSEERNFMTVLKSGDIKF